MTRPRVLSCALPLLLGCALSSPAEADEPAFSASPHGRAAYERAVTRGRARDVLGDLNPEIRATLDELIFLADLQMASGNEQDPLRLVRRVQRELATPRVVSPESVAIVLDDMQRVMAARPGVPEGPRDSAGYDLVSAMLVSAQGAFPSAGDCLDRIASYADEVAVSFLVQEYYADDHYHQYWMREQIYEILLTGGYGPLPLVVIEDQLRGSWPDRGPESAWSRSIAAGRLIVGEDFSAWYREVRGSSYTWEWLTAGF